MQGSDRGSRNQSDAGYSETTGGTNQDDRMPASHVPLGRLAALGSEIAIVMVLCVFAGYRADAKRGGGIFWTLTGAALGTAFWVHELWNLSRSCADNRKSQERKRRSDRWA